MKEESLSRSRTKALADITNDSPIVSLTLTEKTTPSSSVAKNRVRVKSTPGSGEAILRGQVKTLLQKVEEEAELVHKLPSSGNHLRPPFGVVLDLPGPSPVQLLAPTPMNTPQIPSLSEIQDGVLMSIAPIQIAESVVGGQEEECLINRALTFDSPDKSEQSSVCSAVTYQRSEMGAENKSSEDDSSSAWSIQVNLSVQDENEDDDDDKEEEENEEEEEEEEEDELGELCEGLSKMRVEEVGLVPEFAGKLLRFVYNSDGEIEGEEVMREKLSPNVTVLRGLPVPEGKHLRFPDKEEEEE